MLIGEVEEAGSFSREQRVYSGLCHTNERVREKEGSKLLGNKARLKVSREKL